jgi:hypothetical protein
LWYRSARKSTPVDVVTRDFPVPRDLVLLRDSTGRHSLRPACAQTIFFPCAHASAQRHVRVMEVRGRPCESCGQVNPCAVVGGVGPVPVRYRRGEPNPGTGVAGVAQSRCSCGRGEPSPGADVAQSRCSCGRGEPSPGADVAGGAGGTPQLRRAGPDCEAVGYERRPTWLVSTTPCIAASARIIDLDVDESTAQTEPNDRQRRTESVGIALADSWCARVHGCERAAGRRGDGL